MLHVAIQHGNLKAAHILLKYASKITLDLQDAQVYTPIGLAENIGFFSLARILREFSTSIRG